MTWARARVCVGRGSTRGPAPAPAAPLLLLVLAVLAACPHDFTAPLAEAGPTDAPGGSDRTALERARVDGRRAPDTTCPSPCVTTFAGRCGSEGVDEGPVEDARFSGPTGMTFENAAGDLLVADAWNRRIRRISKGVVSTAAASNLFAGPWGVAVDGKGAIAVADPANDSLFWIASDGVVSKLAGGTYGFADGPLATAQFKGPQALVFAGEAGLLVVDTHSGRLRAVKDGMVQTFAGGASPDCVDGAYLEAGFWTPRDVALAADGTLYVADGPCSVARKLAGGQVTMVSPPGYAGFSAGVVVDSKGVIFVADSEHHIIRRSEGDQFSTFAGTGDPGFRNGAGAAAQFKGPSRLLIDASGTLLVADTGNNCIRAIR
jgi:hypothetical protein